MGATAAGFTVEGCFPRRAPAGAAGPDAGSGGRRGGAAAAPSRPLEFPPLDDAAPSGVPAPPAATPAAPPTAEAPPAPAFGEAELAAAVAAARREALAEGEAAGRAAAEAESEAQRERALARLAERLAADGAALDEALERRTAAAAELALAVARAVVPAALARLPLADVEAMLRECLGALRERPSLELALAPALVEAGGELFRGVAEAAGIRGGLAVAADPALAPGDARLRWGDGWAERDVARLAAEAEAVVRRRLPAPGAAAAQREDDPRGGGDQP